MWRRVGATAGSQLRLFRSRSWFVAQHRFNSTTNSGGYDYTMSSDKYNFQSARNLNSDVSCTVLGQHGNVMAISKKYPQTTFLQENGLHPRDLRNISTARVSIIPAIMVRPKCILVNLLQLQAVIKHNEVMILDSQQDTSKLSLLLYDLENKLGVKDSHHQVHFKEFLTSMPYELRALESILMNAASSLEVELKSQLTQLNRILHHLEDHIDRDMLKELLIRSKSVTKFVQKTTLVRDVLSDVLDSDEDLSAMYLTDRHEGKIRDINDHAEAELLLEAYYKQLDEIVQQAERVMTNVKTTEEIVNIMLDSNRNSLMLMELKITIGTLGFTIGMFFAALYGMNLENFIEESPYGFWSVTVAISIVSALITLFNYRKLEVVRRVAMMSGLSSGSRNEWRSRRMRHKPYSHHNRQARRPEWKWLVDKS